MRFRPGDCQGGNANSAAGAASSDQARMEPIAFWMARFA